MSTEYEITETPVEDWIEEGVSFLQANVTIHRNPAIYAEYQPVLEEIQALEKHLAPKKTRTKREAALGDEESLGGDTSGEESLAEEDSLTASVRERLEELYKTAEALWEQYSKDVEVWTLRRVDNHEVEAVQEQMREEMNLVVPPPPPALNPKASPSAKTAHAKKFEKFIRDMKAYTDELNIRCLELAVIKVVVKGVEKPAPSLAGLRRVKARPGGTDHIHELVEALENLTKEGVNILAPHRPGAGA